MYSLVMMTAMVTAPSGPEFNGYFRDLFHRGGCCGASQSNSCCGGGGLFHGRIISFFSFGGGGCCGGSTSKSTCSGSSCCGGSVPAYSSSCCGGSVPSFSCSGSLSCSGGGVPMDLGSPYAVPSPATYYTPPVVSTYSFPAPVAYPPTITPVTAVPTVPPSDAVAVQKNQLPLPGGPVTTRATVVVKLPADAKLYAESQLLELTSGERTFYTPELPSGRDYAYNFKIEYTRGGRTVSESQRVSVSAGKTTTLQFDDLTLGAKSPTGNTAVAAKPEEPTKPVSIGKEGTIPTPAKITVKLPEAGTLFIDGKKNDKAGTERQFTTPPLPAGKEFSYSMKLEMVRNGQPEEVTQKVVFHAGEVVTVDFSDLPGDRRVSK